MFKTAASVGCGGRLPPRRDTVMPHKMRNSRCNGTSETAIALLRFEITLNSGRIARQIHLRLNVPRISCPCTAGDDVAWISRLRVIPLQKMKL